MRILLSIIFLVTFFGCDSDSLPNKSNPYPTDDNLTRDRRPTNSDREEPISLTVKPKVSIEEGKRLEYKINFKLPEGLTEHIEVENLPSGAVFDKSSYIITWTPTFFDANDPKDPRVASMDYDFEVRLFTKDIVTGEISDNEAESRPVTITVIDVPKTFKIDSRDSVEVFEGNTLNHVFEINSFDFPDGPFEVSSNNMPPNTSIIKVTNTKYRVVFSPDYHHVKNNQSGVICLSASCSLDYTGQLVAISPSGRKVTKDLEIEVSDRRQNVNLVVPKDSSKGLDISFQVTAFDPNGEVAPFIKFRGDTPKDGLFSTSIEEDKENNSSVLSVTWKDIPILYNGKVFSFPFEACVLRAGSRTSKTDCERERFSITIEVKNRKPPVFARNNWKAGEIKYLKYNEQGTYDIKIRDGDKFNRKIDRIQIFPESMRRYVRFDSDEDLVVKFPKAGIHQFSLVATSEYGMSSAESFVAEVFKKSRSRTVYLTNTHKDPEAKFFTQNMNNVELLNPYFQRMDKRMLSGRDSLILGTNILYDKEFIKVIEKAMKRIDNVIVASPMIQNMPDFFLEELYSFYKVAIDGRFNDISKTPLKDMHFISRSDFENSKDLIKLKQTTTSESSNPLIFSIGVDRQDCQDVLDLTNKKKSLRYKLGIICDRRSGGRYAILGAEFSDFSTSDRDKNIPVKWLRRMLKTNLNSISKASK